MTEENMNTNNNINGKLQQFRDRLLQLEAKYSEKEQSNIKLSKYLQNANSENEDLHARLKKLQIEKDELMIK